MSASALPPIGLFDSGVGGLSVWRHIRARLPQVPLLYYADQAHVPYGERSAEELIGYSRQIAKFLFEQGAELIVVPCNTATAAAINHLRQEFPQRPFVGMEPAIKPAARRTRSGRVGVLATAGTFQSQRYASLMARFAADITLYENSCPGLVEQIEAGELETPATRAMLTNFVTPMLEAGVDTLILGCTHYPFVARLIAEIAGPEVELIDPAPAVARQAAKVFAQLVMSNEQLAQLVMSNEQLTKEVSGDRLTLIKGDWFFTSGDGAKFAGQVAELLGIEGVTAVAVQPFVIR